MSERNRMVEHCGIVAVQSKRTRKIVLYINHERVLQVVGRLCFQRAGSGAAD